MLRQRERPYRKPEQAALTSKAMTAPAPSLPLMMQATEGQRESGVQVAAMTCVSSPAFMPASSRALSAALYPRSEAFSVAASRRRSLMPVRVVIHSSLVSTIFARSSLVST